MGQISTFVTLKAFESMELIDIGANLTHESFKHDLNAVITSSIEAGLSHIIVTGTDFKSSCEARTLCRKYPDFVSATAGYHPHVASACDAEAFALIRDLAAHTNTAAIGECGLDYNRNYSPAADQLRAFELHLQLAAETQKPLFLHQRDAHDDFYRLLSKYRGAVVGGVVHCFTDSERALRDYIQLDMYIGITGWVCDERRGTELQQLVSMIPADRLLLETDAPYLLPRTITPKPSSRRNEPRYLLEVASTVAACRGVPVAALAEETTANAKRLFDLNTPITGEA